MANELVNIDLKNVDEWNGMVSKLMSTKFYTKLGEVGVFSIISQAKSLNMDPLQALNGGLHYFEGKVGMPAETMCALIRAKGHSISKDGKSDNTVCILHGRRKDNGDTWTVCFSTDDAKAAGLASKENWKRYPQAMLYSRAMALLARQLFPDVIKNCGYDKEELEEITADVKPVSVPVAATEAPVEEVITEITYECVNDQEQNEIWALLDKFSPQEKRDEIWKMVLKAGACKTMELFPKAKFKNCIAWLTSVLEKEPKVKPLDMEVVA
jgi:hypothetical protein